MPTSEGMRVAAALARAVDVLRRSPEPGQAQKAALRALIALMAERSATFRHYADTLTVDGETIPTTDPRLAAFAERLVGQHVAEIAIARGAGADELLALAIGLASDPGHGRIKERLRDANSARVMVVNHQYESPTPRGVSAAFEKVKFDRAVLDEWNKFLEQGARTEAERMPAGPDDAHADDLVAGRGTPAQGSTGPASAAPAARRTGFGPALHPKDLPPAPPPQPRPSQVIQPPALQGAPSLGNWFTAFERGLKGKFPDHFGDVDWGFRVDRAAATVSAGDQGGRASVTVPLPDGFVEESAWILAGKILVELRRRAEKETGLRKKR
jgi:hypothetical protein